MEWFWLFSFVNDIKKEWDSSVSVVDIILALVILYGTNRPLTGGHQGLALSFPRSCLKDLGSWINSFWELKMTVLKRNQKENLIFWFWRQNWRENHNTTHVTHDKHGRVLSTQNQNTHVYISWYHMYIRIIVSNLIMKFVVLVSTTVKSFLDTHTSSYSLIIKHTCSFKFIQIKWL